MKYTTEQLDAIAAKLRSMPAVAKPKQEYTKQAAVGMLTKEINTLQKRGYSLAQIAEALRGEGLDIATPTLKNYLLRTKPARKKTPPVSITVRPVEAKSQALGKASFPVASDTDDI
ncbi:protein mobC [Duganella flavida]|uniref:protein mobC n=1 Tax=Duganella flavida TaxID=2692175 RepID=UPI001E4C8FB5|nr:protein mobC [Duganella flavida]